MVVHGGGPQIGDMLKRLGIRSEFSAGLRVTDAATIEIVEMVLAGSINKQIVGFINAAGGKAVGLCGWDGNMVVARKASRRVVDPDSNIEKIVDLGFVGEPDKVDVTNTQSDPGPRPDPGAGAARDLETEGLTYNVNADTFAGAIAGALKSQAAPAPHRRAGRARQIQKPDQAALHRRRAPADRRRRHLGRHDPQGSRPASTRSKRASRSVVILDGKVPHAVLLELLTDHGAGTLMMR